MLCKQIVFQMLFILILDSFVTPSCLYHQFKAGHSPYKYGLIAKLSVQFMFI